MQSQMLPRLSCKSAALGESREEVDWGADLPNLHPIYRKQALHLLPEIIGS